MESFSTHQVIPDMYFIDIDYIVTFVLWGQNQMWQIVLTIKCEKSKCSLSPKCSSKRYVFNSPMPTEEGRATQCDLPALYMSVCVCGSVEDKLEKRERKQRNKAGGYCNSWGSKHADRKDWLPPLHFWLCCWGKINFLMSINRTVWSPKHPVFVTLNNSPEPSKCLRAG